MAGITDHPFRTFMKEMGAGVVVTELVSATGLEYKSKRTQSLTSFDESQRPVGVQLFGENPEHIASAARFVEGLGADFVDLNFGCPVPKVVKKGAGSALLRDLPALGKVLQAAVGAVKIPVTIKIRTGWDANSRNADQVVQVAANEGITWVAIHGRTRAQAYEGRADWDYIGDVKARSSLPIIGNGDIALAEQAVAYLRDYKLDGIMIGRGALKNPFIFYETMSLWNGEGLRGLGQREYAKAFLRLKEHLVARCDDRTIQIQLKKFAAWFSTGYSGAAQFRKSIFQARSTDETTEIAVQFLNTITIAHSEMTSNEGFLMGGHG